MTPDEREEREREELKTRLLASLSDRSAGLTPASRLSLVNSDIAQRKRALDNILATVATEQRSDLNPTETREFGRIRDERTALEAIRDELSLVTRSHADADRRSHESDNVLMTLTAERNAQNVNVNLGRPDSWSRAPAATSRSVPSR